MGCAAGLCTRSPELRIHEVRTLLAAKVPAPGYSTPQELLETNCELTGSTAETWSQGERASLAHLGQTWPGFGQFGRIPGFDQFGSRRFLSCTNIGRKCPKSVPRWLGLARQILLGEKVEHLSSRLAASARWNVWRRVIWRSILGCLCRSTLRTPREYFSACVVHAQECSD